MFHTLMILHNNNYNKYIVEILNYPQNKTMYNKNSNYEKQGAKVKWYYFGETWIWNKIGGNYTHLLGWTPGN